MGEYGSTYRKSDLFVIFFRPSFLDGGGMFLEVKILENFDPIWGFHPNFFFKIHQFLVITLIDDPRGPFIGRKECILPYMVMYVSSFQHPIYVTYY